MKNKINTALAIFTFCCWVAAIIGTVICIVNPELSIKDSWIGWALYMGAQIIKGIVDGSFKEWASIMQFLISENKTH